MLGAVINRSKFSGEGRSMRLAKKIFGLKVTQVELTEEFEKLAHGVLSVVEQTKPFYSVLFSNEDLPKLALQDVTPVFESIGEIASRKVQARKVLAKYFACRQDEILFNYLAHECPSLALLGFAASMADDGDKVLAAIILKFETEKQTEEEFGEIAKAYFKRKYYFELYKNSVLSGVIQAFFSGIENSEDIRRFELIVKEHIKKLGIELMLTYSEQTDTKNKYDFSETEKRNKIISQFILGIELNSSEVIDRACREFPKILTKNYETFHQLNQEVEDP